MYANKLKTVSNLLPTRRPQVVKIMNYTDIGIFRYNVLLVIDGLILNWCNATLLYHLRFFDEVIKFCSCNFNFWTFWSLVLFSLENLKTKLSNKQAIFSFLWFVLWYSLQFVTFSVTNKLLEYTGLGLTFFLINIYQNYW